METVLTFPRSVFRDDHEKYRDTVRRFIERECKPHQAEWDRAGRVDRETWRKAGREMTFPAEGISGATHAPGPQKVTFSAAKAPLKDLKPGAYTLVVEAAREAGGHEAVRVPFTWGKPGKPVTVKGATELGAVTVAVK